MQALVNSQKMQRLHSIHWYTVDEFGNLAFVYQNKYPKRETRSFASIFVRKVKLDGGYPRILRLFFSQKDSRSDLRINLERLFLELRRKSPVIPPKPLEKFAIGRRAAEKIPEFVKYTSVPGIYRSLNMNLPYLVEILLLSHEGKNKVIYGINRSPAIDVWPFVLSTSFTFPITIGRKKEEITTETSVSDFLEKTGFLEGEGYKMFIHLVCPRLHFLDKSKNAIIFDNFMDAFVKAIEPHLATIRKSQTLRKLKSPDGLLVALDAPKKLSKKTLMFEYFMEGYGMASGDGQYVTTARQVFYAVRKLIINNENITLTGSDFDTFTQKVLTGMFEKYPDLVTKIYFEQRGTFIDYDTHDEFPISTRSVTEYLERMKKRVNCTCRLQRGEYHESSLSFDYPPELGISSVLFVEKQGFREVLVSSGIQDELAISLILSQGYGTRDMKKLMDAFLERGVTVYVLHDCDIDGYQIKNKLLEGSETYNKPLDVVDVGLSLDDIRALGRLIDAEEYTSEKSYSNVLENMSEEERDFFWPGKKRGTKNGERTYIYRRVELNALTMPDLLDFLRQKVKRRKIIPTPDQLHDFKETLLRNFDADSLIWDSLWEVTAIFREKLSKQLLSDNSIRMAVSRAFVRFDDIVKAGKVKNWKEALKDCIKSELDQLRAEIRNTIEKILNIDSI